MRRTPLAVAIGCAVVLSLAGSLAIAQEALQSTEAMEVDIPFSFIVNRGELPAGRYDIGPAGSHLNRLIVIGATNARAGGELNAPVLERLADTGTANPFVVFDNVDGKHILSEAHYPGMDGFLVSVAGGRETHTVIHATKKVPK